MPRMIIFRKLNTNRSVQLAVTYPDEAHIPILYPNYNRAVATLISPQNASALVANAKAMSSSIGYNFDMGDTNPEDIKVVSGFDLGAGSSSNTTTNYYLSCSAGVVRAGSHSIRYSGASNVDPLTLCYDLDGAAASSRLLADGYAQKIRWYAVRKYSGVSGEVGTLVGVMGDADLVATLGAVTVDTGFPTDAEVESVFAAKNAAYEVAGNGHVDVVWVEVGRQLITRVSTTITYTFVDLKDADAAQDTNPVQFIDKLVDHADVAAAALTNTVAFNPVNGIFLGASLETLEASDLASLTIELGAAGSTDDMFDAFDVGTGGSNTLGVKQVVPRGASPFVSGRPLIGYKPQLLFTGGANLDTATTGKWRVRLFYLALPQSTVVDVYEPKSDENTL